MQQQLRRPQTGILLLNRFMLPLLYPSGEAWLHPSSEHTHVRLNDPMFYSFRSDGFVQVDIEALIENNLCEDVDHGGGPHLPASNVSVGIPLARLSHAPAPLPSDSGLHSGWGVATSDSLRLHYASPATHDTCQASPLQPAASPPHGLASIAPVQLDNRGSNRGVTLCHPAAPAVHQAVGRAAFNRGFTSNFSMVSPFSSELPPFAMELGPTAVPPGTCTAQQPGAAAANGELQPGGSPATRSPSLPPGMALVLSALQTACRGVALCGCVLNSVGRFGVPEKTARGPSGRPLLWQRRSSDGRLTMLTTRQVRHVDYQCTATLLQARTGAHQAAGGRP